MRASRDGSAAQHGQDGPGGAETTRRTTELWLRGLRQIGGEDGETVWFKLVRESREAGFTVDVTCERIGAGGLFEVVWETEAFVLGDADAATLAGWLAFAAGVKA